MTKPGCVVVGLILAGCSAEPSEDTAESAVVVPLFDTPLAHTNGRACATCHVAATTSR